MLALGELQEARAAKAYPFQPITLDFGPGSAS